MKKTLAALTILVAGAGMTAAPAQADAPSGSGGITVFLKAPHPQELAALAAAQGLTHAQRLTALTRLVPSDATREQVADTLRAQGYTVTGETTWSVTATGSTATSARLFGPRTASAARALPRVPGVLDTSVIAAFPTTGAPVYAPRATGTLAGPDYRNANTPAGVAPTTGQNSAGATIATLQLSNFATSTGMNDPKATDLSAYAKKHNLPDPVATGQYKAVNVDGGADGASDFGEVNLDQQSILSTAPTANQHAYFAPNTTAGYNDVFAQVYDDVAGTKQAKLPDPNIVAMSVSWGGCESVTGAKAILSLEPILQSLTAAGVTVFASSGDAGIYDCVDVNGDPERVADVDYPASSPYVVAVGGTHLSASASTPNTGSNWSEKAWSCTSFSPCAVYGGPGGSGGGASGSAYAPGDRDAWGGFPAPAYQRAALDKAPFAHNLKRLVPDISTVADPDSGFVTVHAGSSMTYGGTSLAAPVSAAQLTNALADKGRKTGVGDIHGALYSAYRLTRGLKATDPRKAFRDITVGQNGKDSDRLSDPSVKAGAGYDTVTGVGAPLWSALVPYLLDTRKPTVNSVTFTAGATTGKSWRTITARWNVTRGADTSIVGANRVVISRLGVAKPVYTNYTVLTSHTMTAVPGATYKVTVTGRDVSARVGNTKSATVRVPLDDTYMPHTAAGGWARQSGAHDVAGSNIYSTRSGATATATATGSAFSLRYRTGPTSGKLGVYLNGKLVRTINQYAKTYSFATTVFYSGTRAKRTFTFKALSAKTIHLDAVNVTY